FVLFAAGRSETAVPGEQSLIELSLVKRPVVPFDAPLALEPAVDQRTVITPAVGGQRDWRGLVRACQAALCKPHEGPAGAGGRREKTTQHELPSPRPSPAGGRGRRNPHPNPLPQAGGGELRKRLNPRLRAPEYQRVDVVRTLVRVDGLQVDHVADHVEL